MYYKISRSCTSIYIIYCTNILYIKKYNDCVDILLKAIKIFSTDHVLYIELSKAYNKLEETDKAIINIERAIQICPDSENAQYMYALLLNGLYNKSRK